MYQFPLVDCTILLIYAHIYQRGKDILSQQIHPIYLHFSDLKVLSSQVVKVFLAWVLANGSDDLSF